MGLLVKTISLYLVVEASKHHSFHYSYMKLRLASITGEAPSCNVPNSQEDPQSSSNALSSYFLPTTGGGIVCPGYVGLDLDSRYIPLLKFTAALQLKSYCE